MYRSNYTKQMLKIFWHNLRYFCQKQSVTPTELFGGNSKIIKNDQSNITLVKLLEVTEYLEIEPEQLFKKQRYVDYD